MAKAKLINYDDTKKDLLFWIKRFLADKISSVSQKKTKDDFDLAALVHAMNSSKTDTIEAVMDVVRLAQRQGLDGMKKPGSNIEKFYRYVEANAVSIPALTSITSGTIKHFAYEVNEMASDSAKGDMFDVARNFFNYIDDHAIGSDHLFKISKGKPGRGGGKALGKARKRKIVYLEEDEIRKYNKSILHITYRDEVERSRDILIGRLLLFSGITVNELIALRDEDIIQDETKKDTLWIRINGKSPAKREIPVPKAKMIEYLNAYKKRRGVSRNGFLLHTPIDPTKPMTEWVVRGILQRQFKAAKIDGKKATPTVLRNTFGIFIFGKATLDGNPNADRYVQELMGHANVARTRELVKAGGVQAILVAAKLAEAIDELNK